AQGDAFSSAGGSRCETNEGQVQSVVICRLRSRQPPEITLWMLGNSFVARSPSFLSQQPFELQRARDLLDILLRTLDGNRNHDRANFPEREGQRDIEDAVRQRKTDPHSGGDFEALQPARED